MNAFLLASFTLWQREMTRFFRDRSRVIGGIVPPIIFWFFLGSGLSSTFKISGASDLNYMQYFFPGTLVLIFLFTAIFSTISIIEDRREGFLQAVLVAPVPRLSIVVGKLMGSATLAFLHGLPFLLMAPIAGISFTGSLVAVALVLFAVAFALAGVGFVIAWKLDSTQGFHAIMNMALMPMWMLSGALFPTQGVPGWLSVLVTINPLTYCVGAIQRLMFPIGSIEGLPELSTSIAVIAVFCLGALAAAVYVTRSGGE